METRLTVNDIAHTLEGDGERPLIWALHDELGLTRTGFHCLQGHCGSCTILVDGIPQRACVTPVKVLEGSRVQTIEGVCAAGHDVCAAFSEAGLLNCTKCSSGQVMCAVAQLRADASVDGETLMDRLAENICYCLRYRDIRRALERAISVSATGANTNP